VKTGLKNYKLANSIAAVAITLTALGAVFVFSASARVTSDYNWPKFYDYLEFRQLLFCILAVVIMFIASSFNYNWLAFAGDGLKSWLKNPLTYLLILNIGLLVAVLIPGIGTEVNYARRWLRIPIGPAAINFQPSELAKWTMVLLIPAIAIKQGEKINLFWQSFVPAVSVLAVITGLIVIEDFGTAFFVAAVSLTVLFVAGAKWWHFLTPLPAMVGVFAMAILKSPERIERLKAFFTPAADSAQTVNYQVQQSLTAIATGRIFGKGLGRGISKYGHLPEDTTDFIFAIIAEELGFIGVIAIIAMFLVFIFLGIKVIRRSDNDFGRLMAFGIVLAISAQAAINLGVATKLLPTKGIALPFISAGGSHLLLTAAAGGLLMNIAKNTVPIKADKQKKK